MDDRTSNGLARDAELSSPGSGADGSPYRGHAFISYVREDSNKAEELQRTLEAAGIPVWRDKDSLWPGQDWRARIRDAITRDALVFIACFSSHSAARRKSYQNEELLLAVDQVRQRQPDDPWLIPVRFDDCEIPGYDLGGSRTLASLQRADLFGAGRDQEAARLAAAVQRLLRQPGEPPPPTPPRRTALRRVVLSLALAAGAGGVIVFALLLSGNPAASPSHQHANPPATVGPAQARSATPVTLPDSDGQGVYSLAFSPDGKILAAADGDSRVYLWNLATHKISESIRDPEQSGGLCAVAFSPDGKYVAMGDSYGGTYLWNVATRVTTPVIDPTGGSVSVDGLAFSPDSKYLAIGNDVTYLWNVPGDGPATTLNDPGDGINSVAFNPAGTLLAAGDGSGSTYVWNVARATKVATVAAPAANGGANSVAFSPDGKTLAIGDGNGNIYLWSTVTRKPGHDLRDPQTRGVYGVAFSRLGGVLAVCDGNGRVYFWDVADARLITSLNAPGGPASCAVAFSPAGSTLAVSNENDGDTYVWNTSWLAQLPAKKSR